MVDPLAMARTAPTKRLKGALATKPKAPTPTEDDPLPVWAVKKPDAEGALPVPTKLAAAISVGLGPSNRKHSLIPKFAMRAMREGTGPWGLERQLQVSDGEGPEVARILEVFAEHGLPLVALSLWYAGTDAPASAAQAGALLEAALAPRCVELMHKLMVLLEGVRLDAAAARALSSAVGRMPRLRSLEVNARGPGAAAILSAAPRLRSLKLAQVPTGDLESVARAPSLRDLESLDVCLEADDPGVARFLDSPWASGVSALRLSRQDVRPAAYPGVAALSSLRSLELLHVNREGMAAIADASFVPQLEKLKLYDAQFDDAIAAQMAARGLPALRELNLKHGCSITAVGLDHLVRAAPALKLLECPAGLKVRAGWVKRGRVIL
ncbi:MAG: hypothetical protein Q8Q09_24160 [Deltaproteobacteria bacterium]|nr:hypothetical protein [Deltaproteobacteria bacterium]